MLGEIDDRRITAERTENGRYSVSVMHILGNGFTDNIYTSDHLYRLFEELGEDEESIKAACREFYQESMVAIRELSDNELVLDMLREITEENLSKIRTLRRKKSA